MTDETEDTTKHTCHQCSACAAIRRPPELDNEAEVSRLHGEGFFDYQVMTGNINPLDYGRIAMKIKKSRRSSAKAGGVKRAEARDRALEMAIEWRDKTATPPLFLPYTFLENVLYVSGGNMMTQLRRNACGGNKGYFVYYGQALAEFHKRWELLSKTKVAGRPPIMPLLRIDEWPWKTPPIGIDPDDLMPAGWNYHGSGLLPLSINMMPKWPNKPPKLSKDWDGIQGEPGVLRSHVKAIIDHLDTPYGQRDWKRFHETSKRAWGADRWAADIITDDCLKRPYKPFPKPDDEEMRIALTEGRVMW